MGIKIGNCYQGLQRTEIENRYEHYHYIISGVDIGLEKAKLHLKFAEHTVNDRDSV